MPVGVHVVLEQKMVIMVVNFNGRGKISGLKPTLKYEGLVCSRFTSVKRVNINFYKLLLLFFPFSLTVCLPELFVILGVCESGVFQKSFYIKQIFFEHCVTFTRLLFIFKVQSRL